MNIKFDGGPVYGDNDKYTKTKIKPYGDKVNTNFQTKKVPKENAAYKCSSLIVLESFIRVNKKYYPQTRLEECKHIKKNDKMENLINDALDPNSSDESDNQSDNGFDNRSDSQSND